MTLAGRTAHGVSGLPRTSARTAYFVRGSASAPVAVQPAISPEAMRGFVPDAVLNRLDAGHEGWLAELRHVTCMFVGLRPLDWSRTDAWILLQTALAPIQRRLLDYEGSLDKIVVDEKGTTVIAEFGLPPTKTDRTAERAVAAATAIAATRRQAAQ